MRRLGDDSQRVGIAYGLCTRVAGSVVRVLHLSESHPFCQAYQACRIYLVLGTHDVETSRTVLCAKNIWFFFAPVLGLGAIVARDRLWENA